MSQPAELPRKRLGRTGVEVTTVGIGTAWIGLKTVIAGTSDRYLDEELAVQTLHAALESGVRLIDTAALYLNSRSEQLVGGRSASGLTSLRASSSKPSAATSRTIPIFRTTEPCGPSKVASSGWAQTASS